MSTDTMTFSSESVTEGHPDKIADQISDAVLDAVLAEDPDGRVACETMVTQHLVIVAGEISSKAEIDIPAIVRDVLGGAGYTDASYGIDGERCKVRSLINPQSGEIARGVNEGGAGDQGMMFGYATDESRCLGTDWPGMAQALMPLPIMFAHALVERLAELRKSGEVRWLRPDGKAQVSIVYDGEMRPVRVKTVVIAAQHAPDVGRQEIEDTVVRKVIAPVLPASLYDPERTRHLINCAGKFTEGGPMADVGLTGRKIIVDTYGGAGRHGGGAFSGKDPSKVDRSGAYAARWVAKNLVAAGLAGRAEVQLAYAIGEKDPVSVFVDTFGTGRMEDSELIRLVSDTVDLTPGRIIGRLGLKNPIYRRTAAYGHFGREPGAGAFQWESADLAEEFRAAAGAATRNGSHGEASGG